MFFTRLVFLCLLILSNCYADEEAIPFKNIITKFPQSSSTAAKTAFNKDALPYWGVLAASTGILYYYDEKISDNFRYHATNWHIGHHYETHPTVKNSTLLNLPRDIGSMMYFAGDGFIHIVSAAAFITVGKITDNNYAANTGIMILHGLTMTGVYAQLLKRSFGRESPVEKTQPRGAWHPFPSFHKYQSNTAKYDAMPSGHMMTATLTFTVLMSRYEEYSLPIGIFGAVWLGSLGFEMVNNGVHWASDYPLGIAMGYLIGRSVVKMNQAASSPAAANKVTWTMYPSMTEKAPSLNVLAVF